MISYAKKGTTHKTLFGGLLSIFTKIVLLYQLYSQMKRMILYQGDTTQTLFTGLQSSLNGEEPSFDFHKMLFVPYISASLKGEYLDIHSPEVKKHVRIRALLETLNW